MPLFEQSRVHGSAAIAEMVRLEKRVFAAKVRTARALIGWSQTDLGTRVGLTQRAIHKLEQGETEPRRTTVHAIEQVWIENGIAFEDLPDGGFRLTIHAGVIDRAQTASAKRHRDARRLLGVTAVRAAAGSYRT